MKNKVHKLDEAELRDKLFGKSSSPFEEPIWEELQSENWVRQYCNGSLSLEDIEEHVAYLDKLMWKASGYTKPSGRERMTVQSGEVFLTEAEEDHCAALQPFLAQRAALLPGVRNFREEKLGGNVLEEQEQVKDFVRRELQYLATEDYKEIEFALAQVPSLLGADATDEMMDLLGGWRHRGLQAENRIFAENVSRISTDFSFQTVYEPPAQFPDGVMHLILAQGGKSLKDLGRQLTTRYPWPLRDAVWFVLTDEAPELEALKIDRNRANGTHILTFAPWVSEKTIRHAYRSLQQADNQPIGRKGLSAFRFVEAHTEPGQTPKWAALTELWNRRHPGDRFTDRSALRRAYLRARGRLASPWEDRKVPPAQ